MTKSLERELRAIYETACDNALDVDERHALGVGKSRADNIESDLQTWLELCSVGIGETVGRHGFGQGQFSGPGDLAIDKDGNVFVVDEFNHRVQKFSPDWTFLLEFGGQGHRAGKMWYPRGICINSREEIVVSDSWNHRIQIFDPEGRLIRAFGSFQEVVRNTFYRSLNLNREVFLNEPCGLAQSSDESLYVVDSTNHRVCLISAEGNLEFSWGGYGTEPGKFCYPKHILVLSGGELLISDWGNHRIQRFSASGRLIDCFGEAIDGGSGFQGPCGLVMDGDGFVFVADELNHQIHKMTPEGRIIISFAVMGERKGDLNLPGGLAVKANGSLMVADSLNNRITEFTFKPSPMRTNLEFLHRLFPDDVSLTLEYLTLLAGEGDISEVGQMQIGDIGSIKSMMPADINRYLSILHKADLLGRVDLFYKEIIQRLEEDGDRKGNRLKALREEESVLSEKYQILLANTKRSPDNESLAYDFKSHALIVKAKHNEIRETSRAVEESEMTYSKALYLIGEYLIQHEQYNEAIDLWEKALISNPTYAPIHDRLAQFSEA
ncbi:hypothetical protein ACFLT7_02625 [candidate division KSB1 bacterium]